MWHVCNSPVKRRDPRPGSSSLVTVKLAGFLRTRTASAMRSRRQSPLRLPDGAPELLLRLATIVCAPRRSALDRYIASAMIHGGLSRAWMRGKPLHPTSQAVSAEIIQSSENSERDAGCCRSTFQFARKIADWIWALVGCMMLIPAAMRRPVLN
jgi:hypothetical protein